MGWDAVEKYLDGRFRFSRRLLVSLGKNQGEGDFALAQPADKRDIDGLGREPGVDQDEQEPEVWALFKVVAHRFVEIDFFAFGDFGVAVAREVHETPRFVHHEKVEELGFPRGGGDLR